MSIVRITRYRLANCGPNGYRIGPEWHWAYDIHAPGGEKHGFGRGLRDARDAASRYGDRIVEDWPGGKTWTKGPRGGLRKAQPADPTQETPRQ